MEFSKPEYQSGQPFPSPGDLPNPGIEPRSLHCRWILYQLSHKGSPHFRIGKVKVKSLSRVQLFETPWTIHSMDFSRPEYWIGQPFSSPGNLLNPGIEPRSPSLQADSLPAEPQGKPKNTGVGSLSLLQRIFPTRIEPGSPALQADSLTREAQLSHSTSYVFSAVLDI